VCEAFGRDLVVGDATLAPRGGDAVRGKKVDIEVRIKVGPLSIGAGVKVWREGEIRKIWGSLGLKKWDFFLGVETFAPGCGSLESFSRMGWVGALDEALEN
jgi:hypothetical protein